MRWWPCTASWPLRSWRFSERDRFWLCAVALYQWRKTLTKLFCGVYGEAVLSFPGGKLKELETATIDRMCVRSSSSCHSAATWLMLDAPQGIEWNFVSEPFPRLIASTVPVTTQMVLQGSSPPRSYKLHHKRVPHSIILRCFRPHLWPCAIKDPQPRENT